MAKARKASSRPNPRRDAAVRATGELEALLSMIIACARQQLEDDPKWRGFDTAALPDVIRGLAIRGRDLSQALMSALTTPEFPTADFEREVHHG